MARLKIMASALAIAIAIPVAPVSSQTAASAEEAAALDHAAAIERLAKGPFESAAAAFDAERFSDSFRAAMNDADRQALLAQIREIAANAGGITLEREPEGIAIAFEGADGVRLVRFAQQAEPPYRITSLAIAEPEPVLALSRDTLEAQIDALMAEGNRSGIIYVRIDGETVLAKAYGMANAALGTANGLDTVFGIGSRPIDFTVAAIHLLEHQGRLSRDDTLADHFETVPADRAGMTIRQMMTGASGLPDFPANESDWDADLGWIDRSEFERRTMAIPLLFVPGEGDAHSHWAFGVLAAIVERVSGQSYYAFLRENFFDPAAMERTGNYGESRGLVLSDFAAGGGVQRGLPNIPPNWGPTSWLVMGSGGMFSTLGDLERFYAYVTRADVLGEAGRAHFLSDSAQIDGSERGFELFSFNDEERSDAAYVFMNGGGGPGAIRPFVRPLVNLLREN